MLPARAPTAVPTPTPQPRAETGVVVGIDASRNRSGGAIAHLVGILGAGEPSAHGVRLVHLWSYRSLLDAVPDAPWLVKHGPAELERSLPRQMWWQYARLPFEARDAGCDVLLNTDAGSVCRFRPAVVMSRDMLSYEPGEMQRYGWTKARLRLLALRYVQASSLRRADGAVFLTRYASDVIQGVTGPLPRVAIIPHGVGSSFKEPRARARWPAAGERDVECLYVSNAAMYKHQWHVVRALAELRKRGHRIRLTLAGGGSGRAQQLLDAAIAEVDPGRSFVRCMGFIRHAELPALLASADLFVFASSCENMPNTLVEAMAAGLPIACSRRGPMPEVLRDGGAYFDPERPETIAAAVESILVDEDLRARLPQRARDLADAYSWSRCARETWDFLRRIADRALITE